MMALAILATARRLSRMEYSKESPSWAQVAEHFLLATARRASERAGGSNLASRRNW
jgi:hypothetical protein